MYCSWQPPQFKSKVIAFFKWCFDVVKFYFTAISDEFTGATFLSVAFVTFLSWRSLSSVSSTLVKCSLRFGDYLLLLMGWIFCIAFSIFGLAWRMLSVFFMILSMSGFLGLWVATKHNTCLWSSFCYLPFCSCCFGILRASVIPLLTSHFGYLWFCHITESLFR